MRCALLSLLFCWSAFAQFIPGDDALLGNAVAKAGAAEIPGIFVDSIAGNDSTGTGKSNAPFATLAKVTSTLGTTSTVATNIYLKRGSVFRESFAIPTNSIIDCYGSNNVSVGLPPFE